jgi:hypothetical protein
MLQAELLVGFHGSVGNVIGWLTSPQTITGFSVMLVTAESERRVADMDVSNCIRASTP